MLAGNSNYRGRLSAVDLLIKITKVTNFFYKKQLIKTSEYKEVNRTDPSPSVRLPWSRLPSKPDSTLWEWDSLLVLIVPSSNSTDFVRVWPPSWIVYDNKLRLPRAFVLGNPFQSGLRILRARPEPTQWEHLSDASFLGKLLVFPANVRLDWKVIASTNTLAYLASSTRENVL